MNPSQPESQEQNNLNPPQSPTTNYSPQQPNQVVTGFTPQPAPAGVGTQSYPPIANQQTMGASVIEGKSYLTTFLLALILGSFGIDRFYLGKIGTGILKLITVGGAGIWYLYDLIKVLTNQTADKNGARLVGYEKYGKTALIVTIIWFVVTIASNAVIWPLVLKNANKSLQTEASTSLKSEQNANNSINKAEDVSGVQLLTSDANTIVSDIGLINNDQSSQDNYTTQDIQNMSSDCTNFNSDLTSDEEQGSLSSSTEQSAWQNYLDQGKVVVSDCQSAASSYNSTTSSKLSTSINQLNQQGVALAKQLQS